MEAKKKRPHLNRHLVSYIKNINWDWFFLKSQLIFGAILVLGLLVLIIWSVD